jgi:glycosyltransferase involved in cell wall biosynthesis
MRIVALSGFAWEPKGTARARAFPLLLELANRGHQVTLLTVPYDNPGLSGTEFVQEGITVRGVSLDFRMVKWCELPLRIAREIEALQPTIVHIFKPKGYAGAVAWLLLRRGRVPVCVDCDDWEGWGGWNELKRYPYLVKEYIDWQERDLTYRAHSLTVASRILFHRAVQMGRAESCTFYAPNGVSRSQLEQLDRIAAAESADFKRLLGLSQNTVIMYAGHFEPVDDILFFCRAVRPALASGATLVFVGEGKELPKVKQYFMQFPGSNIHYFGRLVYDKYLSVVGAADVACFPYPDTPVYRAKCSARIIDYMACGKPVLTTDVGQNAEYIVSGESGILVNPGAEEELSSAIMTLLGDESLRRRMGRAARERISRHFVWDRTPVEECEQAYQAALTVQALVGSNACPLSHNASGRYSR